MTDADATTEPVASRPSADPSRTAGARPRGTRGPQHRRRMFGSIRSRLLLWFCLLAGAALAASAFVTNAMLQGNLEDRVDLELNREAERFQRIVDRQPVDEDRAAVLEPLFAAYLAATPLAEDQVLLGIVGGEPVVISADAAYRIDELGPQVDAWAGTRSGTFGEVGTPAGPLRYLAVPTQAGDERGVLVMGEFVGDAREQVDDLTRRIAVVSALALLAAAVIAWGTASRALRPVRDLARAARSISHDDVSARLDVAGHDEATEMAETFNDMLDRLESSLDSQRRLLRDVGHELRTPLTILRGHLEQLPDDPEAREATVQLLLTEVDRLAALVTDLRTLAQADRTDFLSLAPVDAGDLVRDVAALAPALARRDWQVGTVEEAVVLADRERIFQAILNLVQNAVSVTGEDDAIELSLERKGRWVVVAVADRGPGIAEADLPRIFDRFERGDAGDGLGTGLGLSIAKAIVDAHGGRIWAQNRIGGGARFSVALREADD
jgi:signal transduction histidine kinase